ncbi:MAG TPA: xanthine dehydrogenase family protein subunit M [Blastocatellia bacterium]|nr:xanthine dehydrogenase family protein subunit M [Blastocatellia bacterium]
MMRLPKFTYRVPKKVSDAVKMIADAGPEAMFVAGGTDLYPNMKRRQQTPRTVISVTRLGELHEVRQDAGGGLVIGASVSLTDVINHPLVRREYMVVADAARTISTPLLRNMGTIGGNLLLDTRCNYYNQNYEWRRGINFCMKKDGDICWVAPSSPKCWAVNSSDLAPVMVALGAKLCLVSSGGERMVSASDIYNNDGINYLNKRHDELLTEIHLPPRNGLRAVYKKLRRRGSFDFPVLGVAVALDLDRDRTVKNARLILGGIAPAPVEVKEAEAALIGWPLSQERIDVAAEACYLKARPLDNTDFMMNWRKQMARPYVLRALEDLYPEGRDDEGRQSFDV